MSARHLPRRQRGGSVGVAPVIIKLRGRWRSVANTTPRPLYPLAKSPGTHCWFGLWTGVEKRQSLLPTGARTPNLPARSRSCIDFAILACCRCTWSVNLSHVSLSKDIQIACAGLPCWLTSSTFVVKGTLYESRLLFSSSCYPVMYEGSFRKWV